jgi:ankyrin repeat protein
MKRVISILFAVFFINSATFADDSKIDKNSVALYIIGKDYKALERALNEGVNPNSSVKIPVRRFTGSLPLISMAAYFSDAQTVLILLERLANPNAVNFAGMTPLMLAVISCRYVELAAGPCDEKIMILLSYGADPFQKSKAGFSAETLADSDEYRDYVSDKIRRWFREIK